MNDSMGLPPRPYSDMGSPNGSSSVPLGFVPQPPLPCFARTPLRLLYARLGLGLQTETALGNEGARKVFVAHSRDARVIVATDVDATELEEKDLHGHNGLVGRSGDLMGALSADIGDVGAEIGHIPRDLVMGAMSFQTMCSHWI